MCVYIYVSIFMCTLYLPGRHMSKVTVARNACIDSCHTRDCVMRESQKERVRWRKRCDMTCSYVTSHPCVTCLIQCMYYFTPPLVMICTPH